MNSYSDPFIDQGSAERHQSQRDRVSLRLKMIVVAVAAAIFAFDLAMPLGVAAGVPYVAIVLIGIFLPTTRHIFLLAILGSALIIVGYFASPDGGVYWIVFANRGLALFAIWITAFIIASRKRMEIALYLSQGGLETNVAARTKELQDSEKILRDIAEVATDWFWEMDENFRFTSFTGRSDMIDGMLPNVVGKTRWEAAKADPDVDPFWRAHREIHELHIPFKDTEYELLTLTGEKLWLQVKIVVAGKWDTSF